MARRSLLAPGHANDPGTLNPGKVTAPVIQSRQRDAFGHEALDLLLIGEQLRPQALHRHPFPAQDVFLDRGERAFAKFTLADLQASSAVDSCRIKGLQMLLVHPAEGLAALLCWAYAHSTCRSKHTAM